MSHWTNSEVLHWLQNNGFKTYAKKFRDQQIDGRRFLQVTDEEILQLLTRSNYDGTEQRPCLGVQIRFRSKLKRLKQSDAEERRRRSIVDRRTPTTVSAASDNTVIDGPTVNRSNTIIRQYNYPITEENHLAFFKKEQFRDYLLEYVKRETIPTIKIRIIENQPTDNEEFSPTTYTIQFNGPKSEIRTVRGCLRQLLQTIQTKEYRHSLLKQWAWCPITEKTIQHIFDTQTSSWTVVEFQGTYAPTLKVIFFNDEKFNRTSPVASIDHIVEKEIFIERFFITDHQRTLLIEYLDVTTKKVMWKETLCSTQMYTKEFEKIIQSYSEANASLIYINEERVKGKLNLVIFGYGGLVKKLLRELEDLFKKHRRRHYSFTQLSSMEIDCLFQRHQKELKRMEEENEDSWVQFDLKKSSFYAPRYANDSIESRMKQLFTDLERRTFKTEEFYYDTHRQIESHIKLLAKNNRCYSIIKRKKKMNSFPMIQESSANSIDHPLVPTNPLPPSPWMICKAMFPNGSIATSIGDIAQQKADLIILPSFRSGLREHLIRCAGEITETNHSDSMPEQLPFITETTPGNLRCQKIFFINWSLPEQPTPLDALIPSIQFFLSRIFQYLVQHDRTPTGVIRSIALAMPEISYDEERFSEEFLEELINQIHSIQSWSFQISLIFLPNQDKLYNVFNDQLRLYPNTGNSYGTFCCSSTVLTITLLSAEAEKLERCHGILTAYLKRSMSTKPLPGFDRWNQALISQFYASARDKCVLLRLNAEQEQQQITLHGPVVAVEQLYQQYRLTQLSLDIGKSFFEESSSPNIVLHYSPKDSIVGEKLFNRLKNDGFNVTCQADSAEDTLFIFCISHTALDDKQFRQILDTAHATGQRLLPVQIEAYNTPCWLRRLIENHCVLRLFGSEEYVNLQYQKLILKIMFDGKQKEEALQQTFGKDPALGFLLTREERIAIHDQRVKQLSKAPGSRFSTKEREDLLTLVQETIDDHQEFPKAFLRSVFLDTILEESDDQQRLDDMLEKIEDGINKSSLKQWIDRYLRQSVKQNLPPFSPTGDLNDAPFRPATTVPSSPPLAVLFGSQFWSFYPVSEPPKESSFVRKLPRRNNHKAMICPKIVTSSHENTTLRKFVRRNWTQKPPIRDVQKPSQTDIDARNARCQQMAECLKKGFEEFQRLCVESQPKLKEPVQQDIKAIFTASPFKNDNIQYRKGLHFRPLVNPPLKFLWNGVPEVKEGTSKRNDVSVLFFYEPPTSWENQQ